MRMEADNCKFSIFDSMGIKCGSNRKKKIKGLLMNIKLATKNDLWKVVKTRSQTERECGIRMAMYMWRFRTWAMRHTNPSILEKKIGGLIGEERNDPDNLAMKYRVQLYDILKDEPRRIGGRV
jgi:hypothetical protein